ncbi:MAG: LacI family transcriptional regulator, partial [Spirochaetia bacterium]|nr:LacI family transcriptional regulator [Spirochaetia bacterium]
YYPNYSGRLLKQGRTDTIAVLSSYFHGIFKKDFVDGIEAAVIGSHYRLSQHYVDLGNETEKIKEILLGRMADAVITLSLKLDPAAIERVRLAGKHIILAEDTLNGFPGVSFDNYKAGSEVVKYLYSKGRRRIALSTAAKKIFKGHTFVDDRFRGYTDGLKACGLELDRRYILEHDNYGFEDGKNIPSMIEKVGIKPDALFCISGDLTAAGFLKEAAARGIKVPDDIAVVGFDDSIIASVTTPGLTTVRQPAFEMGKSSAMLAISLLNGSTEDADRMIKFAPEIIKRESA